MGIPQPALAVALADGHLTGPFLFAGFECIFRIHVSFSSALLVFPLVTPVVVPYIIPYITPLLRSLDYGSCGDVREGRHLNLYNQGDVIGPRVLDVGCGTGENASGTDPSLGEDRLNIVGIQWASFIRTLVRISYHIPTMFLTASC